MFGPSLHAKPIQRSLAKPSKAYPSTSLANARPEQVKPGQAKADPAMPSQAKLSARPSLMPSQAKAVLATPSQAKPSEAMSC